MATFVVKMELDFAQFDESLLCQHKRNFFRRVSNMIIQQERFEHAPFYIKEKLCHLLILIQKEG